MLEKIVIEKQKTRIKQYEKEAELLFEILEKIPFKSVEEFIQILIKRKEREIYQFNFDMKKDDEKKAISKFLDNQGMRLFRSEK